MTARQKAEQQFPDRMDRYAEMRAAYLQGYEEGSPKGRMFTESDVRAMLMRVIERCAESMFSSAGPYYVRQTAKKFGIALDPA